MNDLTISVSHDFSDAPGARYYSDGPASGQEFYEKILKPKFEEAIEKACKLRVDMDGTYGYATSFISESFGTLSREYSAEVVFGVISIKSDEDTKLKKYIERVISDPDGK
jgi:hypothetical protein